MSTTSVAPDTPDAPGDTAPSGAPAPQLSATAAVVAGLAVPDLDLRTARGVVDARARRRLRTRRGALGVAALVAVLAVGWVLVPGSEPRSVVADADGDATTTTPGSSTTLPVTVPVTGPVTATTASSTTTTVKAPVTTLPVPTTAPPTTLPPNQPMTASVTVGGTQVGQVVTLDVQWSDPDLGDPGGPRVTADWKDPNVTTAIVDDTRPSCDAPGAPGSGTISVPFRYSSPGTYRVTVQIRTCDGQGAYAEDQTITTSVVVAPPNPPAGGSGTWRGVVLRSGTGAPPPDAATVSFVPDAGSPAVADRGPVQDLSLVSTTDGAPVTIVSVPQSFRGQAALHEGGSCRVGRIEASDDPVPLSAPTACPAQATGAGSTVS
jgi:hypothetical protein